MRIIGEKEKSKVGRGETSGSHALIPLFYCPLMCAPIDVQIFLFMALFAVHLTADPSHYPTPGSGTYSTSRS